MLMMRFQKVGRKHEPVFRLVLTDSKNSTKSGKFLEVLGNMDARKGDKAVVDAEKVKYWLSKGAKPSDTVHNLLIEKKVIEGKKINVLPQKTVKVEESKDEKTEKPEEPKAEEAASAAEAPAAEPVAEIPAETPAEEPKIE